MRIATIALIAAGLVGAAGGTWAYQAYLTDDAFAQRSVRLSLTDPGSAEFRMSGAKLRAGPLPVVVCGEVNARNKFGGMVGFQPFFFETGELNIFARVFAAFDRLPPGVSSIKGDPGVPDFDAQWKRNCTRE
jgi:hypothetical protein